VTVGDTFSEGGVLVESDSPRKDEKGQGGGRERETLGISKQVEKKKNDVERLRGGVGPLNAYMMMLILSIWEFRKTIKERRCTEMKYSE